MNNPLLIKSNTSPGEDYVKVTEEQAEILMKIHNNSLERTLDNQMIAEEIEHQRKIDESK